MKERPILFSGAMVQAILEGRKTQTRPVVVPTRTPPRVAPLRMEPWIIDGEWQEDDMGMPCWAGFHPDYPGEAKWFTCPYGRPGDRLWVRETWATDDNRTWFYRADGETYNAGLPWRPSIHMPRRASRITLEIVGVRVERVQEIDEADALAEGVDPLSDRWAHSGVSACELFRSLWDSINAPRGYAWDSNPWVWVVEFRRIEAT